MILITTFFFILFFSTAAISGPPPCAEDHQHWSRCIGTQVLDDGSEYNGEWKDNQPHFEGTLKSEDGSVYSGSFYLGLKQGYGTKTWPDSSRTVGEWWDDRCDDCAVLFPDTEKYQKGGGVFILPDGSRYEGQWLYARSHGQGAMTWPDGSVYSGNWEDDYYHGQGTMTYADGDKYVGEWDEGYMHGHGTITYANGDKYVGEWDEGYMHGHGTMTWPDGWQYTGGYQDDKRNGIGTYSHLNGTKYTGGWQNDKKHGHGEQFWYEGQHYKGEWDKGYMHGVGVYTWADKKKIISNNFKDDYVTGPGKIIYPNKSVYEGGLKDDKPHGKGKKTWPDGTFFEIEWEEGKPVGKGVLITADGEKIVNEIEQKDNQFYFGEKIIYLESSTVFGSAPVDVNKYTINRYGTGFAISASGDIITNYHVIKDCDVVKISNRGAEYSADVKSEDKINDLALLETELNSRHFFRLSEKIPERNNKVTVHGYPYYDYVAKSINTTAGNISAVTGIDDNTSEFKFTASIQPGNSGGPVTDEEQNILGVVTGSLDDEHFTREYGDTPDDQNFAIKVSILRNFMQSNRIEIIPPRSNSQSDKDEQQDVKKRETLDIEKATHAVICYVERENPLTDGTIVISIEKQDIKRFIAVLIIFFIILFLRRK